MFKVFLVRKGNNNPKANKAERAEGQRQRDARCRVKRDGLVEFISPKGNKLSEFYALPECPSDVVNDPAKFILCGPAHPYYDAPKGKTWADVGSWIIPASEFGRAKTQGAIMGDDPEAARSATESIRLWAKTWCSELVDSDDLAFVLVAQD